MASPFRFVPYQDLDGRPSVIVDGSTAPGTVLTLSRWPKSPCPAGLEADLSAQMAFMYLSDLKKHGEAEAVSNNHFDQDGLVSVFALTDPDVVLARRDELIDVARAGDFACYSSRNAARVSMVLSVLADPERSPLGPGNGNYAEWSAGLYTELLDRLTEICDNVGNYSDLWADEDKTLSESEEVIRSGRVEIEEDPILDLAIVRVPEGSPAAGGHLFAGNWRKGLHPMAIHNAIESFRVIVITGDRYELYHRYETWVQYRSRKPLLRVDLAPLAEELNSLEGLE
jgi:hypothetical protein